jgi:hypothetical protein
MLPDHCRNTFNYGRGHGEGLAHAHHRREPREGTAVYNNAGEKPGTVSDVVLDKLSGKVAFALMSFGGYLGVGSKMHPLPWSVMRYDSDRGGYVVNLDKNTLMEAPTVERDADFNWADED